MKTKGFATLVAESLAEDARFENPDKRQNPMQCLDVMMLQLVARALQGDSASVRLVLKLLKETQPAPRKVRVHLYSLDENENVVDGEGNVLGPLSDFPDLPQVSGPVNVPKEWLFPKKKGKRRSAKKGAS